MSYEYKHLSEVKKKKVLHEISRLVITMDLAEHIMEFLVQELSKRKFLFYLNNGSSVQGYRYVNECLEFGKSIEKHVKNFGELNWNTFCLQVHDITFSKRFSKGNVLDLVSNFYLYIKEMTDNEIVRKNIEVCESFIVTGELNPTGNHNNKSQEVIELYYPFITNYPKGSNVDHIYKTAESNLYLKTNNSVIRDLLIEFISTVIKGSVKYIV